MRVSFGLFSTKEDIDALISAIQDMLDCEFAGIFKSYMEETAENDIDLPNDRG